MKTRTTKNEKTRRDTKTPRATPRRERARLEIRTRLRAGENGGRVTVRQGSFSALYRT